MPIVAQPSELIDKIDRVAIIGLRIGDHAIPCRFQDSMDLTSRQIGRREMMKRITAHGTVKKGVRKWKTHSRETHEPEVAAVVFPRLSVIGSDRRFHNIQSDHGNRRIPSGPFKGDITASRADIQIILAWNRLTKIDKIGQMFGIGSNLPTMDNAEAWRMKAGTARRPIFPNRSSPFCIFFESFRFAPDSGRHALHPPAPRTSLP